VDVRSRAAPAQRTRILVADDEPHIGRIIKTKLEQGPFAVDLVYDGAEALDAARTQSPRWAC
jgi:two-component system, OmpR family, alkaline phosphatase synthesis response regulator PhoP